MKPLEFFKLLIWHDYKVNHPLFPERGYSYNTFGHLKPEKREKKRIEKFLRLMPKCTGAIIENRGQMFIENIGSGNQYKPKVSWRGSGMRKGIEDITAVINGRMFAIELKRRYKNGKDRQSVHQKRRQAEIEDAGGVYLIVESYADFYAKFWEHYPLTETEMIKQLKSVVVMCDFCGNTAIKGKTHCEKCACLRTF